mgnify:CR=1 FL=1
MSAAERPAPTDPAPVFAALGDRTRLALVMRLSGGETLSISRLAAATRGRREAAPEAQPQPQPAPQAVTTADSPMVAAAKRANRKGRKPSTPVITNDQLNKSGDGVHVSTTATQKPFVMPKEPPVPTPEMMHQQQREAEKRRAAAEAEKQKKAAEAKEQATAAAAAAALEIGVPATTVAERVASYQPVRHRCGVISVRRGSRVGYTRLGRPVPGGR